MSRRLRKNELTLKILREKTLSINYDSALLSITNLVNFNELSSGKTIEWNQNKDQIGTHLSESQGHLDIRTLGHAIQQNFVYCKQSYFYIYNWFAQLNVVLFPSFM